MGNSTSVPHVPPVGSVKGGDLLGGVAADGLPNVCVRDNKVVPEAAAHSDRRSEPSALMKSAAAALTPQRSLRSLAGDNGGAESPSRPPSRPSTAASRPAAGGVPQQGAARKSTTSTSPKGQQSRPPSARLSQAASASSLSSNTADSRANGGIGGGPNAA